MRLRINIASVALSAIVATSLSFQPAGAGSIFVQSKHVAGSDHAIFQNVDHKRHKRRNPNSGEVIAGAVLLGILGVAAAASSDNHYNNHYHGNHEGNIRTSDRNCRSAARQRYRRDVGGRVRAETRHVTYRGGNRYEITGRVRRTDGSRFRRFVCITRVGQVRRLNIY